MKPGELRALAAEIERGVFRDFELARAGFKRGSLTPTNLQDAVDAVPEGWRWNIRNNFKPMQGEWFDVLLWPLVKGQDGGSYPKAWYGEARNPSAALCAAILRAKAAEMEGDEL